MINALLPGEAEVHHVRVPTLAKAQGPYDLVVIGTGDGAFPMLFGDEVLDIVSRSKAAIGIFGTQGRELIARPALDRLIDRLDTWFARYEDDVLMYGRGRNNVLHIGDWLIDQFPLTRSTNNEPLVVAVSSERNSHSMAPFARFSSTSRCILPCRRRSCARSHRLSLRRIPRDRRNKRRSRPASSAAC